MFHRGKPRLVAIMATLVGMSLSSIGCQTDMAPIAPSSCASCGGNPGSSPDGRTPADKQGSSEGSNYLPSNVQQSGYRGEDANGQPIYGPVGDGKLGGPGGPGFDSGPGPIPREINKVSMPPYRVAPPDILVIDAARLVPKPPYKVEPLEVLVIQVTDTLPNQPINGPFVIAPEGTVNLGYGYGTVRVQGLTVDQAQNTIQKHLSNILRNPLVSVSLGQFRGQQQVRGEHLVRPDGTISLGTYGSVYVAGMTLGDVKCAVENHLKNYVINPQVAVDVYTYNSSWYYVIFEGGGYGQQVYRLPITGNETVLDAISNLQGLPASSSQWRIWVARPSPCGNCCDQVLMVDWKAVVQGGSTCTNYQLFPGDRVFVDADCLVKLDLWLAKVLAPVERVLGITLLGTTVYETIRFSNSNGGVGGGGVVGR